VNDDHRTPIESAKRPVDHRNPVGVGGDRAGECSEVGECDPSASSASIQGCVVL
jgi:hypothetical protein